MIVFHYQLRHIGLGKQRMKEYIHAVQPKLVRYTELVQEIRGKSKERKSLLAEKKETPFYLIPKQRELSRRIAELASWVFSTQYCGSSPRLILLFLLMGSTTYSF